MRYAPEGGHARPEPKHWHWAERVACAYLEAKGLQLLTHNYRLRGGELDLVMTAGNEVIVVEVKQRKSAAYGHPAESIGSRKLARLRATAQHYLTYELRQPHAPLRIDAVLLLGTPQRYELTHLTDVA